MADLFKEIVPSILYTKEHHEINKKDYVPFIVNKALSFHYDCIMPANQMNLLPNTAPELQYQYFLNIVRPIKKRKGRWVKKEKLVDLELVKEYYNFSNEKAKAALDVLTDEQIDEIKKRLFKGGTNDKFKQFNRGKSE